MKKIILIGLCVLLMGCSDYGCMIEGRTIRDNDICDFIIDYGHLKYEDGESIGKNYSEEDEWEYEFECDTRGLTGNILYRVSYSDCVRWFKYSDGNWYKAYPLDEEEYTKYRNLTESLTLVEAKEACKKEPYMEEICTHQKIVGLKRK